MTEPETVALPGATLRLYRDSPAWAGLSCAAIGGLEFEDPDAAVELLKRTTRRAKDEGFGGLIGPMDGDTWHSYRTVIQSDGSPPFTMEPRSGRHDHAALVAAGFEPISNYLSARARLVDTIGAEPVRMEGVSVTAWDGTGAEQLIARLFAMSGQAFASNHFFKPIGLEAFTDLYRPVLPMLDPRHILFAHSGSGDLVGFLFGFPDRQSGEKPAAVLKTYASGLRGVGHLLADEYHRRAMDMGHEEVIHALMHETNISSERSARHKARIFRRYALMGLRL